MEEKVTLWHVPQARSFRVLWFLHEAGIPHELVRMEFTGAFLRSPEFLAVSPAGRVPALRIGGATMVESGAMLEYLAETRAPHLGRAPGDPERRAWLEGLHYAETIGQHLANLTQHHIVLREDWMRSPTVMRLEAARLGRVLGGLRPAGEWLLPSGFSAADVAVGYGVVMAARFVRLDTLPEVAAYRARLMARPGYLAALEAEGPALIYTRDFYEAPDAG